MRKGRETVAHRRSIPLTPAALLALFAVVAVGSADTPPFERYEVILERKPFGDAPLPETTPQPAAPVPASESFAKLIRMSAILQDEDRVRVGLIDMRDNKNESFFLSVGEIANGIELVSASWEEEEAVLRKGDEMAVLKLQSDEIQSLTPAEQEERLRQQPTREKRLSYAERRRRRQEAREQARKPPEPPKPPEPKLTGDDLQQHLREYQMEVIRQGLPPLPIPLTPEMDAQLVAEGVLPPLEEGGNSQ